jgi:hypothetical protein
MLFRLKTQTSGFTHIFMCVRFCGGARVRPAGTTGACGSVPAGALFRTLFAFSVMLVVLQLFFHFESQVRSVTGTRPRELLFP